jgi:hypothetical protein
LDYLDEVDIDRIMGKVPEEPPLEIEHPDVLIPAAEDGKFHVQISGDLENLWETFDTQSVAEGNAQANAEQVPDQGGVAGAKIEDIPAMNILMLVVGSRGDVQPFIAVAQELQSYGHRVRLATHPAFRDFVQEHDVEFFDLTGNPAELMAYMVSNPGLTPRFSTWVQGEVFKRRQAMLEIIEAGWRACFKPGDHTRESPNRLTRIMSGKTGKIETRVKSALLKDPQPFVADAIIANPPSLSHVHCAQKLAIPLHIMFT